MGWTTDVRFPAGAGIFFYSPPRPDRHRGPPILPPSAYRELFPPAVKLWRHEADLSPPSSAKVKNPCSYTSTPPYAFMAWYLVKLSGNFTYHHHHHQRRVMPRNLCGFCNLISNISPPITGS